MRRESEWSEGVEDCPVGFADIQQRPDAVVVEVGEPERGEFDPFDGSTRFVGQGIVSSDGS